MWKRATNVAFTAAALTACAPTAISPVAAPSTSPSADVAEQHDAFWRNLSRQCGSAYPGGLTLEPPGDEMLTGTEELIVHFRECSDAEIRAAFHIEIEEEGRDRWDRSRTWVFIRTATGIELRHDHRTEDGMPDESTWYGGHTAAAGTAERQEFIYAERATDDGSVRGWRVEIVPGERYTYGTIRDGAWTWRVDFDLGRTVTAPPPPWGFR
jgi:hypothetical protein